jgi:hypothetical protein
VRLAFTSVFRIQTPFRTKPLRQIRGADGARKVRAENPEHALNCPLAEASQRDIKRAETMPFGDVLAMHRDNTMMMMSWVRFGVPFSDQSLPLWVPACLVQNSPNICSLALAPLPA